MFNWIFVEKFCSKVHVELVLGELTWKVLKYLLCLTVIVGLWCLLYTIDDVRCVRWCESYVVVIDQFCGKDLGKHKVATQDFTSAILIIFYAVSRRHFEFQ